VGSLKLYNIIFESNIDKFLINI